MKLQKTTPVTVFGILNIVFAALGGVGVISSIMLFVVASDSSKNPVVQIIHDNPTYALWMKISIPLGLLACGVLLAAGIGLLKLQPWARTLSIIYAIYAMITVLVSSVVNYFFLVLPLLEQARGKSGPDAAAAMGGAIGGTLGGCLGLVYPILLLVYMLRVKTAEPQP